MKTVFSFIAYDHESFELFNTDLSLWEIFFLEKIVIFSEIFDFWNKISRDLHHQFSNRDQFWTR